MGLSNKSGFYKQTNKQKTPKNKIKKGCTPKQINGNYKDRHLCSIITIGKKAPLLYRLDWIASAMSTLWRLIPIGNIVLLSSDSFLANFHQISTWKIWFQPIQSIFQGQKNPNSPDFEGKKIQIANFLMISSSRVTKNIERRIMLFLIPTLISSMYQIWLKYFPDDGYFGYITKSLNETLLLGHLVLNEYILIWKG